MLLAQGLNITTPSPIANPLTPFYNIGTFISGIIGFFLLVGFIISFFYIITGGIAWITSGGDKAALETARNRIINAVVGLIIMASIFALINLVFPALGLSFPGISLPFIGQGLENL